MIDASVLPAFVATSAVVILVPGSDVFLLLRLSLTRGVPAGMRALAGIHVGNAVQAALMVSGVGLLVSQVPYAILVLKIVGAAYLIYLAVTSLRSAYGAKGAPAESVGAQEDDPVGGDRPAPSAFVQGMLTNVSNPKVLLFFVAFFPQFLGHASNASMQLLTLSVVFIGMAILWEAVIVLGAARIGATINSANFAKVMDTVCAVAFTVLAVLILVPSA